MQILGFGFSVCVVVVAFFSWPSAYFVLLLRWSSGYDARFTRERSPVQSRDEVCCPGSGGFIVAGSFKVLVGFVLRFLGRGANHNRTEQLRRVTALCYLSKSRPLENCSSGSKQGGCTKMLCPRLRKRSARAHWRKLM